MIAWKAHCVTIEDRLQGMPLQLHQTQNEQQIYVDFICRDFSSFVIAIVTHKNVKINQKIKSSCNDNTYENRNKLCVVYQSLSHFRLFMIPWTVAHQAPLSMEFQRQEYWSGLPFLSPKLCFNLNYFKFYKIQTLSIKLMC